MSEKIVNALASDLRKTMSIGVEIETQLEKVFDEDGCRECISIDCYDVCNHAGLDYRSDWVEHLSNGDAETLANVLGLDWDYLVDSYVEAQKEDSDSCWWNSVEDISDDIVSRLSDQDVLFEAVDDCSVSGKEFIFEGPVIGVAKAVRYVTAFFDQIDDSDFTIDTDCSCHIHVQFPNMIHTGCNALQQLIFEELFTNAALFPKCIKERLASKPRWIQPSNIGERTFSTKYNPIQRHQQGTWEFRLWGNVSNAVDFATCLELSIGAMSRAYARYLVNDYKVVDSTTWCQIASDAMRNCEPIKVMEFV